MATLLILEPIFESDFLDCSYGFRPGRNAHQALEEIRGHLRAGRQAVYDADLKSYFDTISHEKLLACLRHRVTDRNALGLIRMWLEAVVVEPGFDALFHEPQGPARWADAKLVRYADDLVVLKRKWTPELTGRIETRLEGKFELEIKREKKRVVEETADGGSRDFPGYTFRYYRDLKGRPGKYLNVFPPAKSLAQEREKLREMTAKSQGHTPLPNHNWWSDSTGTWEAGRTTSATNTRGGPFGRSTGSYGAA